MVTRSAGQPRSICPEPGVTRQLRPLGLKTLLIVTAVGLALAATVVSAPDEAGQFSGRGKKLKEIKRDAEKVECAAQDIVDTVETVDAAANGRTPASSSSRDVLHVEVYEEPVLISRAGPAITTCLQRCEKSLA